MNEIEVTRVIFINDNSYEDCEWCGKNTSKFIVTIRSYGDDYPREDEDFELCHNCRNDALDKYLEVMRKKELGPLRSQPWFRQKYGKGAHL